VDSGYVPQNNMTPPTRRVGLVFPRAVTAPSFPFPPALQKSNSPQAAWWVIQKRAPRTSSIHLAQWLDLYWIKYCHKYLKILAFNGRYYVCAKSTFFLSLHLWRGKGVFVWNRSGSKHSPRTSSIHLAQCLDLYWIRSCHSYLQILVFNGGSCVRVNKCIFYFSPYTYEGK
jgi:hypothetical protein